MRLGEAFTFIKEKGHVAALVGGGGKTSLMYALAQEAAFHGQKVLVTTSTHIQMPSDYPLIQDENLIEAAFEKEDIVVAGIPVSDIKLKGIEHLDYEKVLKAADLILVEADGAKRLPCKVPNKTEPVIPDICDTVIAVMGMEVPGQPLRDICFRINETKTFLEVDENHLMTISDMADILSSEEGSRKNVGERRYMIMLNKCDDEARIKDAEILRGKLQENGFMEVFYGALAKSNEVF